MAATYALPKNGSNGLAGGNGYALHGHGHQRARTGYLAPPSAISSSPTDGTTIKKIRSFGDLDRLARGVPNPPDSTTSTFHDTKPSFPTIANGDYPHEDEMKSGRPRGVSDLGRPLPSVELVHTQSKWIRIFSLPEPLTALLVPLPFVLGSASSLASVDTEGETAPLSTLARLTQVFPNQDAVQHGSSFFSGLLPAAGLATGILLFSGIIAKRNAPESILDRRKSRTKRESSVKDIITQVSKPATVADVMSRILSVLLPLIAALKLGGLQVGFILLALVIVGSTNTGLSKTNTVRERTKTIFTNKFTLGVLALQLLYDAWIASPANASSVLVGYAALTLSLTAFQLPLPSSSRALSIRGPEALFAPGGFVAWVAPTMTSTLASSTHDADMTLAAALTLLIPTVLITLFYPSSFMWIPSNINIFAPLSVVSGVALVFLAESTSIRKRGLISFAALSLAMLAFLASRSRSRVDLVPAVLPCIFVAGVALDRAFQYRKLGDSGRNHDHHHKSHSAFTKFLLKQCNEHGVLHGILIERDSRRILYFTILNFLFMLVQAFYGFVTGSLGLLSDTVHMFFDCLGLLIGLFAAVASKWPPTPDKPYGWGKLNTLSGFGNGVFLCLVSIEFVFEAISEYAEGGQLHRVDELLTVSFLGFLVNMVGLFAFGHAHHGHDHGEGHNHEHSHAQSSVPLTPFPPTPFSAENPEASPSLPKALTNHSHHHSHSNENMIGIWLHVLADALGSVAVIISTLLTKFYPWSGWDPLATFIIAVLIFASAVPLVVSSGKSLLLSLPGDVEYGIRNTLQELSGLRGVVGYSVPRFWIDDAEPSDDHSHGHHQHHHLHDHGHDHEHEHKHHHGGHQDGHQHGHNHDGENEHALAGQQKVLGVIHVVAAKAADLEDVQERVEQFLKSRGMNVVIHVERDGEGRCWCGSGEKRV